MIAGLDRAVDPNEDGRRPRRGARSRSSALAAPFAAFADRPERSAVAGALALDTLVVAPPGTTDGADAGFGDRRGPGGAPGALTVGAVDARPSLGQVRGRRSAPAGRASTAAPSLPPRRAGRAVRARRRRPTTSTARLSVVAGKASSSRPANPCGRRRSSAPAPPPCSSTASELPPGRSCLSEGAAAPGRRVRRFAARCARDGSARRWVAIAPAAPLREPGRSATPAPFSSQRPLLRRPRQARPARARRRPSRPPSRRSRGRRARATTTVNGTSAAAAAVAGAAAVLAQARPGSTPPSCARARRARRRRGRPVIGCGPARSRRRVRVARDASVVRGRAELDPRRTSRASPSRSRSTSPDPRPDARVKLSARGLEPCSPCWQRAPSRLGVAARRRAGASSSGASSPLRSTAGRDPRPWALRPAERPRPARSVSLSDERALDGRPDARASVSVERAASSHAAPRRVRALARLDVQLWRRRPPSRPARAPPRPRCRAATRSASRDATRTGRRLPRRPLRRSGRRGGRLRRGSPVRGNYGCALR